MREKRKTHVIEKLKVSPLRSESKTHIKTNSLLKI